MCFQVVCEDCKKITYGGCGRHVESALRGVPEDKKCKCLKNGQGTKRGWIVYLLMFIVSLFTK